MQREIIKWLQSLDLSVNVSNPRRDFANGVAAADIVAAYSDGTRANAAAAAANVAGKTATAAGNLGPGAMAAIPAVPVNFRVIDSTATSADSTRTNWNEVLRVLRQMGCTTVTPSLVEAVVHLQPTAAQAVLERMYEFFTGRSLAMRAAEPLLAQAAGPDRDSIQQRRPARNSVVGRASEGRGSAAPPLTASAVKGERQRRRGPGAVVAGNYLASAKDVKDVVNFLEVAGEIDATEVERAKSPPRGLSASPPAPPEKVDPLAAFMSTMGSAGGRSPRMQQPERHVRIASPQELDMQVEAEQEELAPAAAAELQVRLAMTRNLELTGGARGLAVAQHEDGKYSRPTASSLVRAATNRRFDVSLSKPKFAPDEYTTVKRNEKIVAQHATIDRTFFHPHTAMAANPHPTNAPVAAASELPPVDAGAPHDTTAPSPVQPPPATGAGGEVSLTRILRGPFASNAAARRKANAQRAGGPPATTAEAPKAKKNKHATVTDVPGRSSNRPSRSVGSPSRSTPFTPTATVRPSSNTLGGTSSGAAMLNTQHIQVNTLPESLRAALEHTGVFVKSEVRAQKKSVQLCRDADWRLSSALSHVLVDVLQARKEMESLLAITRSTSTVHRSDDVVMRDLLSCVVFHREQLSEDSYAACWDALEQNAPGIAASVLHRPSEYLYLLQTLSYAFSPEAAKVPLFHVTGATTGEDDNCADRPESNPLSSALGGGDMLGGRGRLGGSARRGSTSEALLMAARRQQQATTPSASGVASPTSQFLMHPPQQKAVLRDAEAAHLGRVFVFLCEVGRALQEQCRYPQDDTVLPADAAAVPRRVVEQYLLPVAQRFILTAGTPAAVEAVARVLVCTLCTSDGAVAPPAHAESGEEVEEGGSAEAIIAFLEKTLRPALAAQMAHPTLPFNPFASNGRSGSARPEGGDAAAGAVEDRFALAAYHVLAQAFREFRAGDSDAADEQAAILSTYAAALAGREFHRVGAAGGSNSPRASPASMATHRTFGVAFLLLAAPAALLLPPPPSPAAQEGDAAESSDSNFVSLLQRHIVGPFLAASAALPADDAKDGAAAAAATDAEVSEGEDGASTQAATAPTDASAATPGLSALSLEERILALELLTSLSTRLLFDHRPESPNPAGDALPLEDLEEAAMVCLSSFMGPQPMQRQSPLNNDDDGDDAQAAEDLSEPYLQLALSVVARRLAPDHQPALGALWLDVLLSLPDDAFQRSLLPMETEPLNLDIVATARRSVKGSLLPATAAAEALQRLRTERQPTSSIRFLLGVVEPCYTVAPLNQTWNTSAVVHLILRELPSIGVSAVMTIIAAALLSPQSPVAQEEELSRGIDLLRTNPVTDTASRSDRAESGSPGTALDGLNITLRELIGDAWPLDGDRPASQRENEAMQGSADLNSRTASERQESSASASTPPPTPAAYRVAFWRRAMQFLAPQMRAALQPPPTAAGSPMVGDDGATAASHSSRLSGVPSPHSQTTHSGRSTDHADSDAGGQEGQGRVQEDAETREARETAVAILYTVFLSCANPTEMAEVMRMRSQGMGDLACLGTWLDSLQE